MILTIDAEVILTAILANKEKEGASWGEISNYCREVKRKLFTALGITSVYFGITDNELRKCARDYPSQFLFYENRYYQGYWYEEGYFDERNSDAINNTLKNVAMSM